jgi:hypothetical protein
LDWNCALVLEEGRMDIVLPKHLKYSDTRSVLTEHYSFSLRSDIEACRFDWRLTEWASLPEVVAVLCWSTKLLMLGKTVTWLFRDIQTTDPDVLSQQMLAQRILGEDRFDEIASQLGRLVNHTKLGRMSLNRFKTELQHIKSTARSDSDSESVLSDWIESEMGPSRSANLITYLERYEVLQRAQDAGIQIRPEPELLPKFTPMRTAETACLELRSIRSAVQVSNLVLDLAEPKELARVLGKYSTLDVARGGALANILAVELGRNVSEHAHASSAWMCTRLVPSEKVHSLTGDDPSVSQFRQRNVGFLEIIVCDDGKGLISDLDIVLNRDTRQTVKDKCGTKSSNSNRSLTLIDYAFDRLSSTKRDIAKLLHLEKEGTGHQFAVASGLYWVWNLVRSHSGVLVVQTANTCAWYDFTIEDPESQSWRSVPLRHDPVSAPFPGTLVRVILPLEDSSPATRALIPAREVHPKGKQPASSSKLKILWVGDLTKELSIAALRLPHRASEAQLSLINTGTYSDELVLKELQRHHCFLSDGDILVLDLCGLRSQWASQTVATLCHFMLEMNFTSTMGRSTVVLWNVPPSARELFENGIRIAGEPYAHLDGIRRAALMVFDDGQMRLFCGWENIERRLEVLKHQSDLDLDELGKDKLETDEKRNLVKFIAENAHLFEPVGRNRVRLRAWPNDLRSEGWRRGIEWLESIIERPSEAGGIHRLPKRKYFRLPSTGFLVKDFYQFRGLLSNHEYCAKIAWLVAQVISSLRKKVPSNETPCNIITVSRSTTPLLNHLQENYFKNNSIQDFKVLAYSSVDELESGANEIDGPSILVTDVISSGELGSRIVRSLPSAKWIAVIALLDTRYRDIKDERWDKVSIDYGIEILKTQNIEDLPVYALAWRKLEKLPPTTEDAELSEAIDEINVSPVEPFEHLPDTEDRFWPYVDRKPHALLVGHYFGAYHHYLYKVDVGLLLEAANLDRQGETLLEFIVESVARDLNELHYEPNRTVIMHPPRPGSYAEIIAKAVQERTGALYRHVLYKDNIAGHWRFSPFVQHGVPLQDATLVLIDDGTNTGETLMGLLDVASAGHPENVLTYVGITRMLPHKNSFFHNIQNIKNVRGDVKVKFALGLSIPVYGPENCPVCELRHDLTRVFESCPLLAKHAKQLKRAAAGESTDVIEAQDASLFLWAFHSESSVTRLREAFETRDYHAPSYEYINTILQRISQISNSDESSSSLLDLAFIICAEPKISAATVLVHYLGDLVSASIIAIETCKDEHLITFIMFLFHLTTQLRQKLSSTDGQETESSSPWEALFRRNAISIQILSQAITLVLSEGLKDRDDPESIRVRVASKWLAALSEKVRVQTHAGAGPAKAVASIYLREAIPSLRGARFASRSFATDDARALYELADQTAHEFWWHSSTTMKGYIDSVIDELAEAQQPTMVALFSSISPMFQAFGNLCELQQELSEIEELSRRTLGEHPGGDLFWSAAPLTESLVEFIHELVQIGETLEAGTEHMSRQRVLEESVIIKKRWDELRKLLDPAFNSIFPEVYKFCVFTWESFTTICGLPGSVRSGINVIHPLSDDAKGFIPQILFGRFLTIAIQNLQTTAFRDWNTEQLESEAKAYLEISQDTIDGAQAICIRLVDNGHRHPSKTKGPGHGTGLKDVERMARFYNARLTFPHLLDNELTSVELRVLQRLNRVDEEAASTTDPGDAYDVN